MAIGTMGAALRDLAELFGGGSAVGLSDSQLLARYAASRDGSAFAALVARHGPMVLSTCRAILRHEHDIEDAFQATFLVLAKRASSVRDGDALGGWLHRVANRVAIEANSAANQRRRRESGALAMAMTIPSRSSVGLEPEVCAMVHAEIDRLPDRHRLPVVLCDLEGLTYEQAAGRLRWTVPALRCQLSKARRRLRDRLIRRGLTGGALGATIAASHATAAVPAVWAESVVAAATGGASSLAAGALAHAVIRSLPAVKLKIVMAAALVIAGITTAGVVVIAAARPDAPKPSMNAPAATQKPPAAANAKAAAPTGILEVRGRVVGPDGRAVPGATVRAFRDDRPAPEDTSGPDGRFFLQVEPPSPRMASILINSHTASPRFVASAPGFGPVLAEAPHKLGASDELTIRLVEDGPPIEGRIIDLQGRPVAGARVQVGRLWFAEGIDLTTHIEKNRAGTVRDIWNGLKKLPTTIATTTDADGRFHLTGMGRDRVAELLVSGPTIATTVLYAMSRDGPDAHCIDRWPEPRPVVFHARRFESRVPPIKPIVGVVRDKDTGRPIPGMILRATVYNKDSGVNLPAPGVVAVTDAQGRYRLAGLTRGSSYRVFVEPGGGLPYLAATLLASESSPGLGPVIFDIALKRGVLVRGRVTDKATGRPVSGFVHAYTFRDNPHIGEFPGYVESSPVHVYLQNDGRYEIVTVPGRGIIACRSDMLRYRTGIGASAISGYDRERARFETQPNSFFVANYHVLAEVNLDPKSESGTVDLQVDPGHTVALTAVDPEAKPIGGTAVAGIADLSPAIEYPQQSSTMEIHALDSSQPRRVTITHVGRKLIGSVYLKGDEKGPLTVRLQPWGTIVGRIVDDEGKPRGNVSLLGAYRPRPARPEVQGMLHGNDWIGPDGRFRFDGLVPGLVYGGFATERLPVQGNTHFGDVFHDVTVAPGAVKDLGDLKVIPPKPDDRL
jgi:RNA polymerase sigma factor (sigma-70 family)